MPSGPSTSFCELIILRVSGMDFPRPGNGRFDLQAAGSKIMYLITGHKHRDHITVFFLKHQVA
ncbi:MAG: hypothetical protein AMJ59_25310 [Gammaproteobacteria bacterium SG8_31]|nr:MAG: hypothetical protein AMJ59_25310 [Gammaproteobacteria bacterium SG8_31]